VHTYRTFFVTVVANWLKLFARVVAGTSRGGAQVRLLGRREHRLHRLLREGARQQGPAGADFDPYEHYDNLSRRVPSRPPSSHQGTRRRLRGLRQHEQPERAVAACTRSYICIFFVLFVYYIYINSQHESMDTTKSSYRSSRLQSCQHFLLEACCSRPPQQVPSISIPDPNPNWTRQTFGEERSNIFFPFARSGGPRIFT
jgi:hypothetical protein